MRPVLFVLYYPKKIMASESSSSAVLQSSSAAAEVSGTVDAVSPPTSEITHITKEGKDALHAYFTQSRWPRNHRMPKLNTDGMLDAIINKFRLKCSQVARQLRVWKDKRYCYAKVKIVIDPEDVELSIMEGLSMELDEYVTDFFSIIHEGRVLEPVGTNWIFVEVCVAKSNCKRDR